jgi:hypothetical protein
LFSACMLSVCMCSLLFEFLHRFGIGIWSCLMHEYFVSVMCNLMLYSPFDMIQSSFDLKKKTSTNHIFTSPYRFHIFQLHNKLQIYKNNIFIKASTRTTYSQLDFVW